MPVRCSRPGTPCLLPRACEHRPTERRLAQRCVTKPGKIPKIPCRRRGHNSNPLLSRPLIHRGSQCCLEIDPSSRQRRPGVLRSVLSADRLSYSAIDLPATLSGSVNGARRFRFANLFVSAISRATVRLHRNCWRCCGSAVDALATDHRRKHRPVAGTSSGFKNFEQLNSDIVSRPR